MKTTFSALVRYARYALSAVIATASLVALCVGVADATTLHPGDKITVMVYNHPELASSPTVDSTGHVSVPLAGLVNAQNLTPQQLGHDIAARLAPYVRDAAVEVSLITQGQKIFVAGGPGGVYEYSPGETLTGALTQIQAGGGVNGGGVSGGTPTNSNNPTLTAAHNTQVDSFGSIDLHRVGIRRDGRTLPLIDAADLIEHGQPGPALQPGDTIEFVYKPIAVPVKGEVKDPGVAHLDTTEPLSNALLQVGGQDVVSSEIGFILTRNGTEQIVTASSPEYRAPARPGDSIYVAHSVSVGVVGQVYRPGQVMLRGDDSILSALYFAGGPTAYGDIKHVGVIHQGKETEYDVTSLTHGGASQNPQLADGDTVFVPEGHKIDFSKVFGNILSARFLFPGSILP